MIMADCLFDQMVMLVAQINVQEPLKVHADAVLFLSFGKLVVGGGRKILLCMACQPVLNAAWMGACVRAQ